jgi:ATP-dependent RNA helicase DDX52/ROK1
LASLLRQKKISTHAVEFLVLDEADKLFEMGFVEQIDAVVHACDNPDDTNDDDDKKKKKKKKSPSSKTTKKKKCLKALFSATLPETAERLARSVMPHRRRKKLRQRIHFAKTHLLWQRERENFSRQANGPKGRSNAIDYLCAE